MLFALLVLHFKLFTASPSMLDRCISTTDSASVAMLTAFPGKLCNQRLACRKHRQKRNVTLILVEGIVQWLNLLFYIIPNSMLYSNPCYITSGSWYWFGFARWTCWNTVSHPAAVSLPLPQMACKPAALGYTHELHLPKMHACSWLFCETRCQVLMGQLSYTQQPPALYTCLLGGRSAVTLTVDAVQSLPCLLAGLAAVKNFSVCEAFPAWHPSYAQQGGTLTPVV